MKRLQNRFRNRLFVYIGTALLWVQYHLPGTQISKVPYPKLTIFIMGFEFVFALLFIELIIYLFIDREATR